MQFAMTTRKNKNMKYTKNQCKKYNVIDEYGRLIESNVSLKRALSTVKLNLGSIKKEVKDGSIDYRTVNRRDSAPGRIDLDS